MKSNIIAFYPYSYATNIYHGMIQEMISERYSVVDYNDLKNGIIQPEEIDAIYLNWIEDVMDDYDKELIVRSLSVGVMVFWTFHNRVSHNLEKEKECRENILFLIKNSTKIIVISNESVRYLYEYTQDLEESKVHYLPHPEYVGNYGGFEDKELKIKMSEAECVFGCIGSIRPDKNIDLLIKAFNLFSFTQNCVLLIIGESVSEEYLGYLMKLKGENEHIVLISTWIPDYMMNFYIQLTDVILLPYNLNTSMNSGIMLLAFTNKRTVITSNISMAEEFDSELLYKYSYFNETEHIKELVAQMEKVYAEGRKVVRKKGTLLYKDIINHNSKDIVKNRLYQILGTFTLQKNQVEVRKKLLNAYKDKDLWRIRYAIADAWLRNVLSGKDFLERLRENSDKKIAIYGYGKYGKMLYSEIVKKGLHVACIIDQKADEIHENVIAYTLENLKEKLDIVIVTAAAADINQIRKCCCSLNSRCYVISLKDV